MKNILIVLLLILMVASGCSSEQNISRQFNDSSYYSIGDSLYVNNFIFTVTDFEITQEYKGAKTDNYFIVVTIEAVNNGSTADTVTNDLFTLLDSKERMFSNDSLRDFSFVSNDYFSITEDINPGLKKTGRVSFEVPIDAEGFVLGISSNMFDFGGSKYKFVKLADQE